ncbi:MAG: hypothetical protein JSW54_06570 [Fidelibacterota bacterium]|nr:MAG: hypothetical protein JSW54_06570 [Candidatus Neomarinimicrobiota bacterium]
MSKEQPEQAKVRPWFAVVRGLAPVTALIILIVAGACEFQVLEPWDPPRWGVSITLPLINRTYSLAGLAENDTTISEDATSRELQIDFPGKLDTTTIDSSILEVTLPSAASRTDINEPADAPDADDFFEPVDREVEVVIALDSLLREFNPILFGDVDFPADADFPILRSVWDANVAGQALDSEEDFEVFDADSVLDQNDFIQAIRYVQLSDTATSEFITRIATPQFPTNVDSIRIAATSGDYFNIQQDTTTLPPNGVFRRVSDMRSDSLGSDMSLALRMVMPPADEDTIKILANTDPRVEITMNFRVGGLDSLAISTAETPLIEEPPDPLPLPGDIQIIEGELRDPVVAPINQISIADLGTSLPFDLEFQLSFPNFDSLGDGQNVLTLGPYTLRDGNPLISEERSVAGFTFYNPDGEGPVAEFEYDLVVNILEQDVVLPLDGGELGEFNASLGVGIDLDDPADVEGRLHFASITGDFEVSFDAVNTTIEKIPTGFAGFQFGRLSLSLLLRNEIRLPVQLDLQLTGITLEGDSAAVPINPYINYPGVPQANTPSNISPPANNGDTAYTLIVMDETSVRTYWLTQGGTDRSAAWDSVITPASNGTIVDVLNLPPDIIEVSGAAVVEGAGVVEAGKGIWGDFQLLAPFAFILPQDISFLPVDPIPWEPMDESAREQIRTALLSASLTSSVQTKFPIAGKISMLASDDTMFTLALDYLDDIDAGIPTAARTGDTTLYSTIQEVLEADSIMDVDQIVFYPELSGADQPPTAPQETKAKRVEFITTQGDTFWIGHLFDMELPAPGGVNELGWVTAPGDTSQVISLDAERVEWISSDTTVYLKTFITLLSTAGNDSIRTIQSTNWIHFAAYITFDLASGVFEVAEEQDSSDIEVSPITSFTLHPDSTAVVDLDSVFTPPTGMELVDLLISASSSHRGVVTTTVQRVRTGTGSQTVILNVIPVRTGTAKITVRADDDPEDGIDPVETSFLVTIRESQGTGMPPRPLRFRTSQSEIIK